MVSIISLTIFIIVICFGLFKIMDINCFNKLEKKSVAIRQLNIKSKQIAELGALYAEAIHCLNNDTFKSKEWEASNISVKEYYSTIVDISAYTRTLFFKLNNDKIEYINSEDFIYFVNFFESFAQFCTFNKPYLIQDIDEFHLKVERF